MVKINHQNQYQAIIELITCINPWIKSKFQWNRLFLSKTFPKVFKAMIETPIGASHITKLGATSGAGKEWNLSLE